MYGEADDEEDDTQDADGEGGGVAGALLGMSWPGQEMKVSRIPVDDDSGAVWSAGIGEVRIDVSSHIRRLRHDEVVACSMICVNLVTDGSFQY